MARLTARYAIDAIEEEAHVPAAYHRLDELSADTPFDQNPEGQPTEDPDRLVFTKVDYGGRDAAYECVRSSGVVCRGDEPRENTEILWLWARGCAIFFSSVGRAWPVLSAVRRYLEDRNPRLINLV